MILRTSTPSACHGITFIELIVVLLVMSILAGIAIPALGSMKARSDLNTAQQNLAQMLRNAKGLALARGVIATVAVNAALPSSATLSLSNGSSITGISGTPTTETITFAPGIQVTSGNVSFMFDSIGAARMLPAAASSVAITTTQYNLGVRTINVSPLGSIENR